MDFDETRVCNGLSKPIFGVADHPSGGQYVKGIRDFEEMRRVNNLVTRGGDGGCKSQEAAPAMGAQLHCYT